MKTYIDETGKTVRAKNYLEAAEKLYGQALDIKGQSPTTYAYISKGFATVKVYGAGAKVGTYWGVQATTPAVHMLKVVN